MTERNFTSNKKKMEVTTTGLEKCYFYYGAGMQRHWVDNNTTFLNYVSRKFVQSVKRSLTDGRIIVTEVYTKKLPKFKTEDEMKLHVKKLESWKQEEYQTLKEDYVKFNLLCRKDLATVCVTLFSTCHLRLRTRFEEESEYQEMITDEIEDAMKLHEIVRKICNGSTGVVKDDVMGSMIESLYSLLYLRGEDCDSLSKN